MVVFSPFLMDWDYTLWYHKGSISSIDLQGVESSPFWVRGHFGFQIVGIQNSFVDCSHISYCIGRVAHLCHHFPVLWNILLRKNVYYLPKSFQYRIVTTLCFFLCRNPSYRGYHEGFMCLLHALGLNTGHKTYRQSFQLIFWWDWRASKATLATWVKAMVTQAYSFKR